MSNAEINEAILRDEIRDLTKENKTLSQAIRNIIECWDNDHMSRLEHELNAAEELL